MLFQILTQGFRSFQYGGIFFPKCLTRVNTLLVV
jgi:hypothetical protein